MLYDAQSIGAERQQAGERVRVRHAPLTPAVPSATDGSSCRDSYGHLTRKAPLIQRRSCFDSAEFFMAKEAGLEPLPLYEPRIEPSARRTVTPQPSRLSSCSR